MRQNNEFEESDSEPDYGEEQMTESQLAVQEELMRIQDAIAEVEAKAAAEERWEGDISKQFNADIDEELNVMRAQFEKQEQ